MNTRFRNALLGQNLEAPPIWFMRQAGRYHSHYQKLRAKHSFMDLCKVPELAAQVAMGPIEDFDFDVAILFSDLLFPLEAFGMGLEYTEQGPRLGKVLNRQTLKEFRTVDEALPQLEFQKTAVRLTRAALPENKSLVGFVGGPWTLFVYACEGTHKGSLSLSKESLSFYDSYLEVMLPLLKNNIQLQLDGGAEVVYLFDTAAGELGPDMFQKHVETGLMYLAQAFPGRLAYYFKNATPAFLSDAMRKAPWAGLGFDHQVYLPDLLKNPIRDGMVQGNFDQHLLLEDFETFKKRFEAYLAPFRELTPTDRARWVSGLGHGVLPKTPEAHVRYFVEKVREAFQ